MEVDETIHRFQSTGILLTQPRQTMELEVNGQRMILDAAEWTSMREYVPAYDRPNPIPNVGQGILSQIENEGNRATYSTLTEESIRQSIEATDFNWAELPSFNSSTYTVSVDSTYWRTFQTESGLRFYNNIVFEDNGVQIDLNEVQRPQDPYTNIVYGTGEPHQEEAKRKETPNFLKMIKTK